MAAPWPRVRDVFEDLVDRDPADAGEALSQIQASEPEVAAEVRSLLEHHSRAGQFMDTPAAALDPEALDDAPLEPGEIIGAYRVEREIGRGGMGRVFLATDTRLLRPVALKLLPAAVAGHSGQRERLRREARAAALLSHPGICTIYALEEIDGRVFMASEYIAGASLRSEIAAGPRPAADVLHGAAIELSEALACAHERGITHRDLKPENIMRAPDGRLKILDFGLALLDDVSPDNAARSRLTAVGTLLGTPAYMAPEQLKGEPADSRSDVFALGVVLYELATGVHPFEASTPLATAARVLEGTPAKLEELRPDLPSRLIAALERALSKRPADRFPTASALREALVLADAPSARTGHDVAVWWRRHQMVVIVLYLLASAAAWQVKEWAPGTARVLFPFVGILSVVGAVFRGHLLFAESTNQESFAGERARARPVTIVTDVMIALALLIGGALVNDIHDVWSLLVMGLGIGIALACLLVERATSRGAFHEHGK